MVARSVVKYLVLALAACGAPQDELTLDRVQPPAATNIAATPVLIEGTGFRLPYTSNLDDGELAIGEISVALDDIVLDGAAVRSEHSIEATVPAGLALGAYDVRVTLGHRSAVLAAGYIVSGSALTSTLTIPPLVGRNTSFVVTMTVTNTGQSLARDVTPSQLTADGTGTVMLVTAPSGSTTLAAGASTSFAWTYRATADGTVAFSGHANALDEASQLMIRSSVVQTPYAEILEAKTVAVNPLGNGSFAYVTAYQGRVYVGPDTTGSRVVRVLPDGSGPETLSFNFARDTIDNQTTNGSAVYTSIGATGCVPNTPACGPDNEDGRGLFASGVVDGTEWLVLGGTRDAGELDYIYMTTDVDLTLDFRYVDLSAHLGPSTRGFSAALASAGRLYLGFPDSGGSRPYFIALTMMPSSLPGLDASATDALNLQADNFPGFQTVTPAMVDSLIELGGLLYVANHAGVMVATVSTPRPYDSFPGDWDVATPSSAAYSAKTSITTAKLADLFPSDRAVPQLAVFGGRLFMARNTTTGPQLWSCNPAIGGDLARCEPAEWMLVAPNTTGDALLTTFNDPRVTAIAMVTATPLYLYVGFDSSAGVQVFRTASPAASAAADFEGENACSAAQHPATCAGLGGNGIGEASDTKILDGKALAFATYSMLWLTVGNGTSTLRLVTIP